MIINDALALLEYGKCVSRKNWTEEDGYLVLMKGMKFVWKIITKPIPNAGNHIFSFEELCADDWKEYDEKEFPRLEKIEEALPEL